MIGNRLWWRRMFTENFAWELSALSAAMVERFLPTFDRLEEEAEEIANEVYQRLGQTPISEDSYIDMGDAAELAHDQALAHCERMTGVRQGLLNLATAGVYHLFEQQVALFVQKELIDPREEQSAAFMAELLKPGRMLAVFEKRLRAAGIDYKTLPSYAQLDELRLLANVVKHGTGSSSEQLRARNRMLFVDPLIRASEAEKMPSPWLATAGSRPPRRVDRPLAGNDIYVTAEEFAHYTACVIAFWAELDEALHPVDSYLSSGFRSR